MERPAWGMVKEGRADHEKREETMKTVRDAEVQSSAFREHHELEDFKRDR
ncbi:hypothetical protein HPP92_002614 [Vanilla planifolia]|uniref:Uncharacterized protein n=1 Tax=Vanilla planifolia TaxID=51239 RepID=A0A835SE37_VANPL|nr:hypothetical protein HPP92_002614 [Vanilla planifolia]